MSSTEQYRPLERGTVIANKYEIEKYLGESLIGPTYVVRHQESHKLIAIKFIRPEYNTTQERVRELIRQAKRVNHKNVVRYGKVGEFQGQVFFTQEYFPSKNLRQEMLDKEARNETFSIADVVEIASEVLQALAAIHESEIYHTNLKPENILIRYKTQDHGAKVYREIKITDIMTASILGDENIKPSPYRSPECWEGGLSYRGPQSDVYSIGQVLYELLIGKPARGTYFAPTSLRDDLNDRIDQMIEIALSPSPQDRYPSPQIMLDQIRTYFSEEFLRSVDGSVEQNKLPMYIGGGIVAAVAIFAMVVVGGQEDKFEIALKEDESLRTAVENEAKAMKPGNSELRKMHERYADAGMIFIPEGPTLIGALAQEYERVVGDEKGEKNSQPKGRNDRTWASPSENSATKVNVKGFYIDRFEWNNPTVVDPDFPQYPTTNVTYGAAAALCESVGKRLCTSTEWEKACKGWESKIFSYGDRFDSNHCLINGEYVFSGEEECLSSYGVFGMSAGPREWTDTFANDTEVVIKGGGYKVPKDEQTNRCSFTTKMKAEWADSSLSFRCCLDAEAPPAKDPSTDNEAEAE